MAPLGDKVAPMAPELAEWMGSQIEVRYGLLQCPHKLFRDI